MAKSRASLLLLAIFVGGGGLIIVAIFFSRYRGEEAVVDSTRQATLEQIKQEVPKNAPISFRETSGEAIAGFNEMGSQGFAIFYLEKEDDLFKIDLAGKELEREKKAAEEFLLDTVLKTRDTDIVCGIHVSFVDISSVFKIESALAEAEQKGRELPTDEKNALIDKLYQEMGGPKVISEKLSICP